MVYFFIDIHKEDACPAEMWLPNHNNSAKGARHKEENKLIGFVKPRTISDPMTELLRMGARKLSEAAIQAELSEFSGSSSNGRPPRCKE